MKVQIGLESLGSDRWKVCLEVVSTVVHENCYRRTVTGEATYRTQLS